LLKKVLWNGEDKAASKSSLENQQEDPGLPPDTTIGSEGLQSLVGLSLRSALSSLEAYELKFSIKGYGRVHKILPSSLELAKKKKRITIILK
jgi:hypothetical protein